MDKFLEHYECYLTPLTPIHIGCGEDFEPTNYSIIDNVLYHFEPSKLTLSLAKREELLNAAKQADLLKIQQFFVKEKNQVEQTAHYVAEVSPEIATEWQNKIGTVVQREANGNKVYNNLYIQRTSYLLDQKQPYVPASSFKGAMATALLDFEHQKAGKPKPENKGKGWTKQFIGEFAESLLRVVKFGDFVPTTNVNSKVYYALNFKKAVKDGENSARQSLVVRRETIVAGQYRALKSELAIWKNKNPKQPRELSLKEMISALNKFYCSAFEKELQFLLDNHFVNKVRFETLTKLVRQVKDSSNVALVRLGKFGADAKVYSTNIAQIKIMGKKGSKPEFKNASTTLWLAGEQAKQASELQPFGWALLEVKSGDFAENELLKKWCEIQPHSGFNKAEILARRDEKIAQQKQAEREKAAKAEAERLEQERKAQALANANENQKLVLELVAEFDSSLERQQDINSPLLKKINGLFEQALNWDEADKTCLLEAFTLEKVKSRIEFKRKDGEKNFKKQINKLAN